MRPWEVAFSQHFSPTESLVAAIEHSLLRFPSSSFCRPFESGSLSPYVGLVRMEIFSTTVRGPFHAHLRQPATAGSALEDPVCLQGEEKSNDARSRIHAATVRRLQSPVIRCRLSGRASTLPRSLPRLVPCITSSIFRVDDGPDRPLGPAGSWGRAALVVSQASKGNIEEIERFGIPLHGVDDTSMHHRRRLQGFSSLSSGRESWCGQQAVHSLGQG